MVIESMHDGMCPHRPAFPDLTNMPKFEAQPNTEVRSGFVERRRLRRIRMIVELTHNLISDMTVCHREAQCLVQCARKAILDLHPHFEERYERVVRPHFERILAQRWPSEVTLHASVGDIVN
jgi:hypothetical protein